MKIEINEEMLRNLKSVLAGRTKELENSLKELKEASQKVDEDSTWLEELLEQSLDKTREVQQFFDSIPKAS